MCCLVTASSPRKNMDSSKSNKSDKASARSKRASPQRRSYTNAFKLRVAAAAKGSSNRAAAREFGIDESQVRRWRASEEILGRQKSTARAVGRGQTCRWPGLERRVAEWVHAERVAGRAVSTVAIRVKAGVVAHDMGLTDFKASPSWCTRFICRNGLTVRARTPAGQKLPDGWEEKVQEFKGYVHRVIQENNFPASKVGNIDTVRMSFDTPQTRTANEVGEEPVEVSTTGHDRTRFTVVLGCMADGTKLQPLLIFKRSTLPREKLPGGCVVHCNGKGWMNEEVMKLWLEKCWRKQPGSLLNPEGLLIMESPAAHRTDGTKQAVRDQWSQLAIVPGGLTCKMQQLDAGVNHAFRVYIREEWEKWMTAGLHQFTPSGRIQRATFSEVCTWVIDAWAKVKLATITNSFLRVGINLTPATLPHSASEDTDTDSEEASATGTLPQAMLDLFHSDSEDSDFEGLHLSNCESDDDS